MTRHRPQIQSYCDAAAYLGGKRERPLANNTRVVLVTEPDEQTYGIGVRLHSTLVVVYRPDGSIELDSGGWYTVTTKERINRYLPSEWAVYSDRGTWCLYRRDTETGDTVGQWVYEDGATIALDGTVTGAKPYVKYQRGRPRHATRPSRRRPIYRPGSVYYTAPPSAVLPDPQPAAAPLHGTADAMVPDQSPTSYGTDDERRWAEFNRKFNDLIYRRAE